MPWKRRESHYVGSYAFHWFADGTGAWIVGVWREETAPDAPRSVDLREALAVHYTSAQENPKGHNTPARAFCEQFMSDIPVRARAIRDKLLNLRSLEAAGLCTDVRGDP